MFSAAQTKISNSTVSTFRKAFNTFQEAHRFVLCTNTFTHVLKQQQKSQITSKLSVWRNTMQNKISFLGNLGDPALSANLWCCSKPHDLFCNLLNVWEREGGAYVNQRVMQSGAIAAQVSGWSYLCIQTFGNFSMRVESRASGIFGEELVKPTDCCVVTALYLFLVFTSQTTLLPETVLFFSLFLIFSCFFPS